MKIVVMLPVLGEMAIAMKVHPLYLMFPAALSCSMAFHTPVGMYFAFQDGTLHSIDQFSFQPTGTPPNAIAAGVANIGTKDVVSYFTFFLPCIELLFSDSITKLTKKIFDFHLI